MTKKLHFTFDESRDDSACGSLGAAGEIFGGDPSNLFV